MRKAKTPRRSIRYLLSADWGQHRISMKKIADRVKKAKQRSRTNRSHRSPGTKNSAHFPWEMNSRTIVLGVMCVLAAAALITARQPARDAEVASVEPAPEAAAPVEPVVATPRLGSMPRAAAKPRPRPAVAETVTAVPTKRAPVIESPKAPTAEEQPPVISRPAPLAATTKPAAELTPGTEAPGSNAQIEDGVSPVTITGCLERDHETFRLTDTSGTGAPKSRSWKFGFLKKRSAPVELVNPGETLRLAGYVGRRIAATGTLVDRELRIRSVRQVKAVCD